MTIKTPTQKNKEIGVLMLLLAADTVADVCTTLTNNGALPKDFSCPLSTELIAGSRRKDIKLLNNKVSPSSFSVTTDDSSDGDTDSIGTPVPESSDDAATAELGSVRWLNALEDEQVLDCIMSFTDWRTAVKVRQVSRAWFTASLSAAVVCRLPHTKTPAVFVPCRMAMESLTKRDEARLCASSMEQSTTSSIFTSATAPVLMSEWSCTHCGAQNYHSAQDCTCSACGCFAPAPIRIFLGQLRRDATVPMVRWFVEDICGVPQGALRSVENHCNRATGRGKGCAWAYVANDGVTPSRILSYHHRAYYDVVGGIEGVWITHHNNSDALTKDAAFRGSAVDRPRHMPRTAMVVELPARPAPFVPYVSTLTALASPWQPYSTAGVEELPSYSQFTNDTLYSNVSCWDFQGRPARRFNPYGSTI